MDNLVFFLICFVAIFTGLTVDAVRTSRQNQERLDFMKMRVDLLEKEIQKLEKE